MSALVRSRHLAFLDMLVAVSDMRKVGVPKSVIDRSLVYLAGAAERSMEKGEARATSLTEPSDDTTGDPRRN